MAKKAEAPKAKRRKNKGPSAIVPTAPNRERPIGRPPYEPSKENRDVVMILAANGIQHQTIGRTLGIDHKTLEKHFRLELDCGLDQVKALIKSEVDKANKELADFERVKKHALLDAAFSVDGGELTPSLKVRRKVVKEKFADQLKTLTR